MRPRIGVTLSHRSRRRIFPAFWWAIRRAGGTAVRITAPEPLPMHALDGLVVGGGDDIGIELYGGGEQPQQARVDPVRDVLEIELLRAAHNARKPVLGVCRGAQMLNIARGGTLHGDIYAAYPGAPRLKTPLPRKTVRIEPGSRLATHYGTDPSRVNALHTQSVDRLGAGLAAVAWDEAGIVQAIEQPTGPFQLGVQWHPELLVLSRRDHALFRALVHAAKARLSETGGPE